MDSGASTPVYKRDEDLVFGVPLNLEIFCVNVWGQFGLAQPHKNPPVSDKKLPST